MNDNEDLYKDVQEGRCEVIHNTDGSVVIKKIKDIDKEKESEKHSSQSDRQYSS